MEIVLAVLSVVGLVVFLATSLLLVLLGWLYDPACTIVKEE